MRLLVSVALAAALAAVSASLGAQQLFGLGEVRDLHFTFAQQDWWNQLLRSQTNGLDVRADLVFEGVRYPDVGIRIKGASSASLPGNKKPFNVTIDAFVSGQTLAGTTTFNLNNGAVDPTLTREVISYEIFRNYIPTPRTAYTRVHFNDTYWGIFIVVEQPNKAMIRRWFRDDEGTRYKGDPPSGAQVNGSTLQWFGSGRGAYTSRYELKNPAHPNAWNDLINLIDKLNNTPNSTFRREVEQVLDVDRALWYLAVQNVVVNSDDYMGAGHNYYMYFDPDDGRMNMLPWDLNEAFGVHGPATDPWLYPIRTGQFVSNRPLVRRLFAVLEYRELYHAHYRTVLEEWMSWNYAIEPLNKRLQDMIWPSVASDPNYLYPLNRFLPSFSGRFWGGFHWIWGLQQVTENREAFLRTLNAVTKPEPQITEVTALDPRAVPGQPFWVTARVTGNPAIRSVRLRYSTVGAFRNATMFDDGSHRDGAAGDGVYGGSFVASEPLSTVRYYLLATDTARTVQVAPKRAEFEHFSVRVEPGQSVGSIVINEILADNEQGDVDEVGEREDWIELHNLGNQPVDVGGRYLTDDPLDRTKWQIPANNLIAPGGFLRIWADGEPADGALHASFRLSKQGEVIAMYDTDAQQNRWLDGFFFGRQRRDRSYARVPDGGADLFFVWDPTAAAPLLTPGATVRYDARRTGSPNDFDLRARGAARVGAQFTFELTGGVPNGIGALIVAAAPDRVDLGALGILAIDLAGSITVPVALDANGARDITLTVPSSAQGARIYAQALSADLSNALAVWFQ